VCLYIGLNESDESLHLPKHNIWNYPNYNLDENFVNHRLKSNNRSPVIYISFPSAKDPSWKNTHPGTAAIQVVGSFPFDGMKQWENTPWQKRGEEYNDLKKDITEFLLGKLLELVPQVKDKISWIELSTPLSTKHFSGYQSGEIYGLEHSPQRFRIKTLRPKTRFKNLFLTGQDIVCVGVGAAIFSGIITAVSILNRNLLWTIFRYKTPIESNPSV
jgi:all-trans-retinol 13,14-reductase